MLNSLINSINSRANGIINSISNSNWNSIFNSIMDSIIIIVSLQNTIYSAHPEMLSGYGSFTRALYLCRVYRCMLPFVLSFIG